jgi:alpha-glucosidase
VVLAVQAALKGTPCLYQGDELALTEADLPFEALQDPYGIPFWPQFKGRDGCRTPMPWVAEAPQRLQQRHTLAARAARALARAVDVEQRDAGSPLRFAQNILEWRRRQPQLLQGDITFFDAPEPVLAFRRDLPGQPSVLAAFNPGTQAVTFAWLAGADAAPAEPAWPITACQAKGIGGQQNEPRASGPNNRVSVLGIVASG